MVALRSYGCPEDWFGGGPVVSAKKRRSEDVACPYIGLKPVLVQRILAVEKLQVTVGAAIHCRGTVVA